MSVPISILEVGIHRSVARSKRAESLLGRLPCLEGSAEAGYETVRGLRCGGGSPARGRSRSNCQPAHGLRPEALRGALCLAGALGRRQARCGGIRGGFRSLLLGRPRNPCAFVRRYISPPGLSHFPRCARLCGSFRSSTIMKGRTTFGVQGKRWSRLFRMRARTREERRRNRMRIRCGHILIEVEGTISVLLAPFVCLSKTMPKFSYSSWWFGVQTMSVLFGAPWSRWCSSLSWGC